MGKEIILCIGCLQYVYIQRGYDTRWSTTYTTNPTLLLVCTGWKTELSGNMGAWGKRGESVRLNTLPGEWSWEGGGAERNGDDTTCMRREQVQIKLK